MAKFCSKCGNELKEGARFCSVCGNPVKQVQSGQSAATAAGTNEERQGVFSQQQGFTAQDMQYQQMAGSAAPVKKNKNLCSDSCNFACDFRNQSRSVTGIFKTCQIHGKSIQ